ncbi:MAG: response regulator [Candidatus Latescibacteria bacterium]|nr:response regulator [Candidatus Latescibacterota bacterium]
MKERKILVIDDEEGIRDVLCDFLNRKGYQTTSAADAIEMIVQLNKELPDIIFLDIRLPKIDGSQLLKLIKQLNKEIIVIMMSAYATEEIAKSTLQWEAFDYIRKPFKFEQVERILSAVEITRF